MNHEKINRKPYSDICYDKGKKKKEKALGLSLAEKSLLYSFDYF